jgi:hypothetical protein
VSSVTRGSLLVVATALVAAQTACALGGVDDVADTRHHPPGGETISEDAPDDAAPEDTADPDTATPDDAPPGDTGDTGAPPGDTGGPPIDTGPAPTDGGCTPTCASCGAPDGCGGTCKTGPCAGGASCVAGTCVAPTTSWLSPLTYPSTWTGSFAKAISWTMASESPSTIHYTLDGSAPGPTSTSGASPLTIFVATSATTIKWYADDGVKEPTVHSFVVGIDSALQSGYGYAVDNVKLDGTSPVVVTTAGKVLNGSAKYQAWVGSGCPGCREQIVYGVGSDAQGCLYDYSPSTWPGVSGTGTMKITAPSTAGTYKIRIAWALQLSCTDALGTANPLGVKPTTEIGVLIVK